MTDKEKIKEEIEYRLSSGKYSINSKQALEDIIVFIDSLSEEHNEDLEEEIEIYSNNVHFPICYDDYKRFARHFAEWQKQHTKEALQTEYEKGRFDMREEIMKGAVLETKVMMDCDGDGIETPYEEWLTLEDTEIPYPDNLGLKEGDKVKIIIIKEE